MSISVPKELDVSTLGALPTTPSKSSNPLVALATDLWAGVASRRAALGLTNPGLYENLTKEVTKDVFLNNYFFTGLRADLSKSLSINPAFQLTHSFSLGSQMAPPYGVAAFYATDNVLLQGNMDNDGSLSGRFHTRWAENHISKANVQFAQGQPAMVQLEHDYRGPDSCVNFKALNPSLLDGAFTGVAVGSLLQSVTPSLALGLEAVYSAQSIQYPPDAAVSYVARYTGPEWVASAQMLAQGSTVASFWRRVTDKVEAGIETSIGLSQGQAMMGGPPTIEASTTIGAKYEFRQSVFRGQIDSSGKVACLLERRVLPVLSVLLATEIDHSKSAARLGLGLQFEAAGDDMMMDPATAPQPPRPPM